MLKSTCKNVRASGAAIHKLRTISANWNHRNLSLKGKALVINGLLTSTLRYLAANVHSPPPPGRFRKSKISSPPFYGIINDHSLIAIL